MILHRSMCLSEVNACGESCQENHRENTFYQCHRENTFYQCGESCQEKRSMASNVTNVSLMCCGRNPWLRLESQ
jgi:hypothetical protein